MQYPKVLAVTKRMAELCGAQSLLYTAGFQLIAATNLDVATSVIKATPINGVIVCKHSWSDAEREGIARQVATLGIANGVVMRCPGCSGCDEPNQVPGTLCDTAALSQLLAAMSGAAEA